MAIVQRTLSWGVTASFIFGIHAPVSSAETLTSGETAGRAVVVIEGGGSPHPFTSSVSTCDGHRPEYIQALVDAELPVFTAPGYTNRETSTSGESRCPPQPPLEVQWNTSGYPTQAGQDVLGFLGYLNVAYGYRTFDLVGYSYGGVVARATVSALKTHPPKGTMAPAFSYAQTAIDSGITISTIITVNSPHLGAPAYDVAGDPESNTAVVANAWGPEYAKLASSLVAFQDQLGAGAIQVLRTSASSHVGSDGWNASQVGVLDGVRLTLIAGDYCDRHCAANTSTADSTGDPTLRTDGTVPVYSQLMLPCPAPCPSPPGAAFVPPGLVPEGSVTRMTFPTVHSRYVSVALGLPDVLPVTRHPDAIRYIVKTVLSAWEGDGVLKSSGQ